MYFNSFNDSNTMKKNEQLSKSIEKYNLIYSMMQLIHKYGAFETTDDLCTKLLVYGRESGRASRKGRGKIQEESVSHYPKEGPLGTCGSRRGGFQIILDG
jgi:hypothetical protein